METENFQSNVDSSSSKNFNNQIIFFVLSVLFLGIVFGIYVWQKNKSEKLAHQFQSQLEAQSREIADLKNTLAENQTKMATAEKDVDVAKQEMENLSAKYCKGTWKNGVCMQQTCVDSDINEKPNDIYIKGAVTFTNKEGIPTTITDECDGPGLAVDEMYCYESPQGSGNYVNGRRIETCRKGCFDGACKQ